LSCHKNLDFFCQPVRASVGLTQNYVEHRVLVLCQSCFDVCHWLTPNGIEYVGPLGLKRATSKAEGKAGSLNRRVSRPTQEHQSQCAIPWAAGERPE
jgi:succinate dehydrogenase/fumarate reductase-like Fe-S protein